MDEHTDPGRLLLVMHQSGIVVGLPLMLGGQFETVSQAKAAIVDDVQQLMVVSQGVLDAVPTKHQHRTD